MNIFYLAYKQLEREGKLNKYLVAGKEFSLMINRAKKIRKHYDNVARTQKARETRLRNKK